MNFDPFFEIPTMPMFDEARYKLEYFYNERGERTINCSMALGWIDKGISTYAMLKDKEGKTFRTRQLYWITTDRTTITLQSEDNVHYSIRKSLIRVRYVRKPTFVNGDTKMLSLEKAKECLDEGREIHAFFTESDGCRTTTASIKSINLEDKSFKTVTDMSYQIY